MAGSDTLLFGLLSGRASWLTQRQALLAQNVANADTPGWKPLDLQPAKFDELLARGLGQARALGLAQTDAGHLVGAARNVSAGGARKTDGFESAPDGNAVVLPEQLEKMATTQLDYELTTNLYKRYVGLMKTALGTSSQG